MHAKRWQWLVSPKEEHAFGFGTRTSLTVSIFDRNGFLCDVIKNVSPKSVYLPNQVFIGVESILATVITSTRGGSFNKYLLSTHNGPGTVLDSREILKISAFQEYKFQWSLWHHLSGVCLGKGIGG